MGKQAWSVAEAKARLSEVIERAGTEGPQRITKNGKSAVIVVSEAEWQRRVRRKGSLAEFFAKSPLRKVQLDLEGRREEKPGEIEL